MYILASETSRSRATQLRSPRDRIVASLGPPMPAGCPVDDEEYE